MSALDHLSSLLRPFIREGAKEMTPKCECRLGHRRNGGAIEVSQGGPDL